MREGEREGEGERKEGRGGRRGANFKRLFSEGSINSFLRESGA